MIMRRSLSIISKRNQIALLIEFQVYLSNTLMLFVYPECCYLNRAIFFAMRSEINGRLRIRIHRYLDSAVIPFLKKNFMTFNSIR